jgi:hypothetical protein
MFGNYFVFDVPLDIFHSLKRPKLQMKITKIIFNPNIEFTYVSEKNTAFFERPFTLISKYPVFGKQTLPIFSPK